jgi:GntR family transcriptional regulator / MocR family aminotransferase
MEHGASQASDGAGDAAEAAAARALRDEAAMWRALFRDFGTSGRPLQQQIRQTVVAAIETGRLHPGARMPSSRRLADVLDIARNTAVLAYAQLVEERFLVSRERSGYYVAAHGRNGTPAPPPADPVAQAWEARFAHRPADQRNIVKPADWLRYPYPFIYGQFDPTLFPTNDWRECARSALSVSEIHKWARDLVDGDDPELVDQLRLHVLPRRGIWASPDEIIVTIGAQQALFMLADLLVTPARRVGVEDPGYPDARNIFGMRTSRVVPLPVDSGGLVVGDELEGLDLLVVTAGCHCPTGARMAQPRRDALLQAAEEHDVLVVEDDYEGDLASDAGGVMSLKAADRSGRVVYVGSLSKTLAPGLRLGYVVASAPVIRELRALRRLMLRHPPLNNQRAAALFLSLGHYRAHLRRVGAGLAGRAEVLAGALDRHLPAHRWACRDGRSSAWIEGPEGLEAGRLARAAADRGVLIEPGEIFFAGAERPARFYRLGFGSIPAERIEAGIAALAQAERML